MNTKQYYKGILVLLVSIFTACNAFLDEMPDRRTQIDTPQKVTELLVSAYPTTDPMAIYEHRSDNVMDNGTRWGTAIRMIYENYFWLDNTAAGTDSPESLWNSCYSAVATSNQAIKAMSEMGMIQSGSPQYGEALLCRAYAHFLLVNTFCNPYSEASSATDLGIPYVEEPETTIGKQYSRETVKYVYEKIAQDIEQGFPLIDDNLYEVPLYHFNKRAAAAFATRFYLFYGKYDLALKYANLAIEQDPSSSLRDINSYLQLTSTTEWRNRFISKNEPANLLLLPLYSLWGRTYYQPRYNSSEDITNLLTYWSSGPWGRVLSSFGSVFGGSSPVKFQPKYNEIFEVTNEAAGTGYPHVVQMAFTTDETLLCRAEIYTMLKQYDEAAQDLSFWYVKKGGSAATASQIVNFYTEREAQEQESLSKQELAPWLVLVKPFNAPFQIEAGVQEKMLQGVLHARRIETLFSGLRWLDVRRFGIEVIHNVDGAGQIVLSATDPRRTIQLPEAVIAAGMQANPR